MKFQPLFKEKIWGGAKIRDMLGLDFSPHTNCGEAWVLSGVPGSQTPVVNGFLQGNELNELVEVYMDDLVGEKVFDKYGNEFPILIKFIDANDYLSIQVHPDDKIASEQKIGNGKSEMWYILDAEPGAKLFSGFSKEMTKEIFLDHLERKSLEDILNMERVSAGDAFYIPAGRVHALGPGILLAEIQQTSDVTYRIYDWERVDDQGKQRELHTDLALKAIDFRHYASYRSDFKNRVNRATNVVDCPYFTTNMLNFNKRFTKDYTMVDSFVLLVCVGGSAEINYEQQNVSLTRGETMLIPAEMETILILPTPCCEILEVYVS
jgi:mannose-6-phosphate isomerase